MHTEKNKETESDAIDTNEDILTKTIGAFGRWQKLILILIVGPAKVTANWTLLAIVFLAPKTTFTCLERSNSSEISNSTCYSDCVQYEYFSDFGNTIISEWDLICKREWLANFSQIICMFGVFIGSFVLGYIADRCGRRITSLTACMQKLIVTLLLPFSPTFWSYTLLRFLDGWASGGIMLLNHAILLESVAPHKREIVNSLSMLFAPFGLIILTLFAFYLRSWDHIILGTGVVHLLFLTYFFILLESPRWLLSSGKTERAKKVMTRIAKGNRLPTDRISQVAEDIHKEAALRPAKAKASCLDLFVKPSLRMKNLLSCVMWFMIGLSHYGGNQYIGQTSKNPFIAMALTGTLQIPGILINGACNRRFGRRATQIWCFIVCGICNGLLAVPDDWFYFKLVAGSVGMGTASGIFSGVYMYTPELFPTVARAMALGASSMASRMGSMVAPFVAGLSTSAPLAPPAVFALAPLLGALACYFLPETRGIKLPDHIED